MSQALEALTLANTRRLEAAAWRREIASLPRPEAFERQVDAILDPSEAIGSLRLSRFLSAAPRVGPAKAAAILYYAGINSRPADRQIRDLSKTERRRLAAELLRRAL